MNSKPCSNCLNMMKSIGVKKIAYSTGDPNRPIVVENINNISYEEICISRYMRALKRNQCRHF